MLRYTSRLVHETTCEAMTHGRRLDEMKSLSNSYTIPISRVREHPVGIKILDNAKLTITALGPELVLTTTDIRDRSAIDELRHRGEQEAASLAKTSTHFASLCEQLHSRKPPIADFEAMNESYWI